MNYFKNGEPINQGSFDCLIGETGLLSLASSMYIKETDPKLLEKVTKPSKISAKLEPVKIQSDFNNQPDSFYYNTIDNYI